MGSLVDKTWKSKGQRDARLNRIRRLLAGASELPLIDFQRFDLGGLSVKGQRSSGFGQMGGGVTFSAELNIGNTVAPGLVRMGAGGNAAFECAPRSLIVVQRDARNAWTKRVASRSDKPAYQADRPVSLHLLEGFAFTPAIGAAAAMTVGIGSALSHDENGIAIGLEANAEVLYNYVRLDGARPQYYSSPHDPELVAEFDSLVNNRIRHAIALFVARQTRGKVKKAVLGLFSNPPGGPLPGQVEQVALFSDFIDAEEYQGILDNRETTNSLRQRFDDWSFAWTTDAGAFFKGIWQFYYSHNVKTSVLKAKIDQMIKETAKEIQKAKSTGGIYKKKEQYYNDIRRDPAYFKKLSPAEHEKRKMNYREIQLYDERIALRDNLVKARALLEKRKPDTGTRDKSHPACVDSAAPKSAHKTKLRIHSIRAKHATGGGMKVALMVGDTAQAGAGSKIELEGDWEHLRVRFQHAGDACGEQVAGLWIPPSRGLKSRRILTRENTRINKKYLELSNTQFAKLVLGDLDMTKGDRRYRPFYGTMDYRSVRLVRSVQGMSKGEDDAPAVDKTAKVELLSGSGVSRGLSFQEWRLRQYAEACRKLLPDPPKDTLQPTPPPAPLDDAAERTETRLSDELCVPKETLRTFFKEVFLDGVPEGVGIIVEANFAFDLNKVSMTEAQWEEKDYFDLDFAEKRLSQKTPDDPKAKDGNGTSYLQVLRLRLRQVDATDKRRNVFGLGWGSPLSGSYEHKSGRGGLGGSIFRSYSAGVEGTIDLYRETFGRDKEISMKTVKLAKDDNKSKAAATGKGKGKAQKKKKNKVEMEDVAFATEYMMASVALFNA